MSGTVTFPKARALGAMKYKRKIATAEAIVLHNPATPTRNCSPASPSSEPDPIHVVTSVQISTNTLRRRPAQHRRELVERLQLLDDRRPQRLELEAVVGRPQVREDRVFGTRGDDRLGTVLDEHVGAPAGAAVLPNRHQPDDAVRAPVLAVAEKHHAAGFDVHGNSNSRRLSVISSRCLPTTENR